MTIICYHSVYYSVHVPDIASGPEILPAQPKGPFPFRSYGSKTHRSFSFSWYKDYSWLEYLLSLDTAFYYPCRLFNIKVASQKKLSLKWDLLTGNTPLKSMAFLLLMINVVFTRMPCYSGKTTKEILILWHL